MHSRDEANRVLARYLRRFNRQFFVPAVDPTCAYEPVPAGFKLDHIFCYKYERLVHPDNTVHLDGRVIRLLPLPPADKARAAPSAAAAQRVRDG